MNKIIIIASSTGMINQLSERAKALFPECEISVVCARHENYGEHNSTKRVLGKDIRDEEKSHEKSETPFSIIQVPYTHTG